MTTTRALTVTVDDSHGPSSTSLRDYQQAQRDAFIMTVTGDGDYALAGEMLVETQREVRSLEDQRDDIVKPLNDALKRVRALYKPALDSLTATKESIKKAMLSYKTQLEASKAAAAAEARRLMAAGQSKAAMALVDHVNTEAVATGVSSRKTWKLRVVDPKKVPKEFWIIDEAALRREAVASGWNDPPTGVEYYQEESLTARR